MQVGQFPASAASSLIEGYCEDFVGLAAILAQTLEQVVMRQLDIEKCRPALNRTEKGMRDLADAIRELLDKRVQAAAAAPSAAATADMQQILGGARPAGKAPGATPGNAAAAASKAPTAGTSPVFGMPRDDSWLRAPVGGGAPRPNTPARTPAGQRAAASPTAASPAAAPPAATAPSATPPAAEARTGTPTASSRLRTTSAPLPSRSAPAPAARPFAAAARPQRAPAPNPAPPPAAAAQPKPVAALTAPPAPAAPEPDAHFAVDAPGGLRGTSRTMPLLSVFQFLGRMRKDGFLCVQVGDETMAFEFHRGFVQASTSDSTPPGERLGELLAMTGACTADDLAPLLDQLDDQKPDQLGALVIERGLATNGQVLEALEQQVRLRFHRACKATDTTYEFLEGAPGPTDGRIKIAPIELTR
jgi:hypothetical protein